MPSAPSGATWTAAPRIVRSLHYRQDRRGFMERGFVHLFLVPADGGTERQLTRGAWNVGARFDYLESGVGHDWTPDGRFIVFDVLAAAIWGSYTGLLGYFGGKRFEEAPWKGLLVAFAIASGIAVGVEIARHLRQRRRMRVT